MNDMMQDSSKSFLIKDLLRDLINKSDSTSGNFSQFFFSSRMW